jgi:hypothetical protein
VYFLHEESFTGLGINRAALAAWLTYALKRYNANNYAFSFFMTNRSYLLQNIIRLSTMRRTCSRPCGPKLRNPLF